MSRHGCGALNIDECRIATDELESRHVPASDSRGNALEGSVDGSLRRDWYYDGSKGRWPANIIHDGSRKVMWEFAKYGEHATGDIKPFARSSGHIGDTGSVARYFTCCPAHSDLHSYLQKMIGVSQLKIDPVAAAG
jgi:hypothetical protein